MLRHVSAFMMDTAQPDHVQLVLLGVSEVMMSLAFRIAAFLTRLTSQPAGFHRQVDGTMGSHFFRVLPFKECAPLPSSRPEIRVIGVLRSHPEPLTGATMPLNPALMQGECINRQTQAACRARPNPFSWASFKSSPTWLVAIGRSTKVGARRRTREYLAALKASTLYGHRSYPFGVTPPVVCSDAEALLCTGWDRCTPGADLTAPANPTQLRYLLNYTPSLRVGGA